MDYTILYAIIVVCGVVAIVLGAKYLKNKDMVDETSLQLAASILNLSVSILKELNIKNEPELTKIASIVAIGIDTAIDALNTDNYEELFIKAKENALKACDLYNLKLTEEREAILDQLLEFGLKAALSNRQKSE